MNDVMKRYWAFAALGAAGAIALAVAGIGYSLFEPDVFSIITLFTGAFMGYALGWLDGTKVALHE